MGLISHILKVHAAEDTLLPQDNSSSFSSEESRSQRLARKTRDNPFMVVGLVGCTVAVIYGAYSYKNRGHLSTSNYLMQLRVIAQSTVVGCLTVGVCMQLYQRFTKKTED